MPPQKPKKTLDKRSLMKLEILEGFENSTPAEQERLRKRWNDIPHIQDFDSVLEEARTARKNATPFRVK